MERRAIADAGIDRNKESWVDTTFATRDYFRLNDVVLSTTPVFRPIMGRGIHLEGAVEDPYVRELEPFSGKLRVGLGIAEARLDDRIRFRKNYVRTVMIRQ